MARARDPLAVLFILVAAVTVLRVAGLLIAPVELHGDEAQYWRWSRALDWGYFSKPPLIAWAIGATTAVFGDAEWAVRLWAPIVHAAAAAFLALFARDVTDDARIGGWTGALYILMPAVWLSAAIASTDALVLMCWCGALFALGRLLKTGAPGWGSALGVAIGAGYLAKYAIVYFAIGLALALVLHAPTRAAFFSPGGGRLGPLSRVRLPAWLALGAAALLIAPNIAWNAAHDFATFSHTAANANWTGPRFRVHKLAEFLVEQLAVVGPLSAALLVWAAWRARGLQTENARRALLLAAFIAPALITVAVQAFVNRANANWAAVAYPAALVLIALVLIAEQRPRWLAAAVIVNAALGLAFALASLWPALADSVGAANAFKRARGWAQTTAQLRKICEAGYNGRRFDVLAVDNRLLFHGLDYYGRAEPLPLRMWLRYEAPKSHAEASAPLCPGDGLVLVASERESERARIAADFAALSPIGQIVVPLGGGKERRLALFAGEGLADPPPGSAHAALCDARARPGAVRPERRGER